MTIRLQNGQSAINVFNFKIIHRVLSVAVFALWQGQHNDSRLESSSVPPRALGMMWSTLVALVAMP
ncbi:hypothetical protein A9F07_28880 [Klebsiella pneumoniae]|nr:hypothetical protein A9F07_28880 [Klebsiella pneumoniae]